MSQQQPAVPAPAIWQPSLQQRQAAASPAFPGAAATVTPARRATPARPVASRAGELTLLAKIGAAIQIAVGSSLGLGAALLTAAAASSPAAGEDSDPGAVAAVRLWAIGIGLVMAFGGRLAWRGNSIGRVSGIVLGGMLGLLAAIAIVDPPPGVPGFASAIVLGLMLYVVIVDVFVWRHR